jgi:putative polyhydroxyalkanoic acid system protein
MSNFNMTISHSLTEDEAANRIKSLLGDVKAQFADKIQNLREEWDGNVGMFNFSAMGFPVSGTLTVRQSEIEISGTLPFAAMLFKARIESAIRDRAKTLLV